MLFNDQEKIPLSKKLEQLNWLLILMIVILASVGFLMLYSAGGGSLRPWLIKQLLFFSVFFVLMIGIALTNINIIFRASYFLYAIALIMVIVV
ncbi:MAG: rod shape-determining protein RodA, partial [Pelagibacterales bacterium]|nr:rod shape-determining protein RodA [Pelagibacterales bacterium]